MASHFTERTLLGSSDDDILVSQARPKERLYGGGGDDILISYGLKNHLHGGGGADTFAFMLSEKHASRKSRKGQVVQHVIHDFSSQEGDAIDLSHLVSNLDVNKIKFRRNSIRGGGVEVRFVEGSEKKVAVRKSAFEGIEEGIEDALGEVPEVTHRRHKSLGSKFEVFIDGELHHEIILKHAPGAAYVPGFGADDARKQRPFGPFAYILPDGIKKLQDFYEKNSHISITPKGIPFYGNNASIDVKPPIALIGGLEHWRSPSFHWHWKKKPPFFSVDFDFYIDMFMGCNLGPKFTLYTGSIPGAGKLPSKALWSVSETLSFDPPFDVRADAGVGLTASVDVKEDGTNKKIGVEALYTAGLDFSISQHGPYTAPYTKKDLKPLSVGGGSDYKNFDNLAGVEAKLSFVPSAEIDIGIGVSGDGFHADLIDGGPKISAPIDITIGGNQPSGIHFNGVRIDMFARLIDVGYRGWSISGHEWSYNVANMGELGFVPFPGLCFEEASGNVLC